MAVERIGDMTLDDLKVLIKTEVDHRIQEILRPKDPRTLAEILDAIDRNRWTPPPDAPSNLQLLREDRDA